MASKKAVATTLAMFAETFPTREVSGQTADVWTAVLTDVSDEALSRATLRLCRDAERRFFPSSGEVFAAIKADAPRLDVPTVLHRIEKLGYYDPKQGWVYPTNERIREAFGDEIARAYKVAGSEKLFAPEGKDGNTITRDVARRTLADQLENVSVVAPTLLCLPNPERPREIEAPKDRRIRSGAPLGPLADDIEKAMKDVAA